MKVALVHDYLREYGGAERVVEALHEIFPDAPLFTAYYNSKSLGIHAKRFEDWDIKTSWFQSFPLASRLLSPFRIFAPLMFESFELSNYDIVISSSAIYFAKSVITKPETLHISYIHTPPRYLYGFTTSFNYKKNPLTRVFGELANHFLRLYDYQTSQRPDLLVANSKNIQQRIKKFYRRDSKIIYPPIDLEEFKNSQKSVGDYYLSLNRLTRGKGTEIAVAACTELNLPLKVAGSGSEIADLKKISGKTIEFIGAVTDSERVKLFSNAKALIVCSEDEDFGITPVEAMAAGTPIIAAKAGGYLETIIEGKTGEFFEVPANLGDSKEYIDQTAVDNLVKLLENFNPEKYNKVDCQKQAEKFSKDRFKKEILALIDENYPQKK